MQSRSPWKRGKRPANVFSSETGSHPELESLNLVALGATFLSFFFSGLGFRRVSRMTRYAVSRSILQYTVTYHSVLSTIQLWSPSFLTRDPVNRKIWTRQRRPEQVEQDLKEPCAIPLNGVPFRVTRTRKRKAYRSTKTEPKPLHPETRTPKALTYQLLNPKPRNLKQIHSLTESLRNSRTVTTTYAITIICALL